MDPYDLFLIIILVGAIVFGALKGLAWQIASLSAIFVSYFVALNFHKPVSTYINTDEPWNRYLAMFVLYMGTSLVIWIAFALVRRIIEQIELKEFDRHAGALLGAINGAIVCVLITLFAVTLPVLGDDQKTAICQSKSGYWIAQGIGQVHVGLPEDVHNVVHPYLHGLKEKIDEVHGSADVDGTGEAAEEESDGQAEPDENRLPWQPPDTERTARSLLDRIDEHFEDNRR